MSDAYVFRAAEGGPEDEEDDSSSTYEDRVDDALTGDSDSSTEDD
jgi:hypothetical protein